MKAHFFSTKVVRLMFAALLTCGLLALVALSLSGATVNAAPLGSYPASGGDPQLRWITVTAGAGVGISDTYPGEAPGAGSKIVYVSESASGIITVTPHVSGTAPLAVIRAKGLNGEMLVVTAAASLLTAPMTDSLATLDDSQDVTFTLQGNYQPGTGTFFDNTRVFTLSFTEDGRPPIGGIVSPTASAILTQSAPAIFTVVMTATDPDAPEASGVKSVQISTGASGPITTGVATGSSQWTYNWTLPAEDNVTHTLWMTATDYVGNFVTANRSITVDTQGPITTGVVLTPSHATNTWLPASTVVITWTGFSDESGIGSYRYLWDGSGSTVITSGVNASSTVNTTAAQALTANGNYYFHVAALDNNGNWSGTVMTGPFKIDTGVPSGSFGNPASGWVTATASLLISGTALSPRSEISQVQVVTGTGGPINFATYLSPTWVYTWPIPAENGVAHTLLVTITDKIGSFVTLTLPITVDNVGPGAVINLTSTTHTTGTWSNQPTITTTWGAAADNGGSGLAGYATGWDTNPTITTTTPVSITGAITTQSSARTDNADWYYHLRAVDALGNWSSQWSDLGPFKLDTQISATVGLTVTPAGWTNRTEFTLTWNNPADLSAINNVRYLMGSTSPVSAGVGNSIGSVTTTVVTTSNQGQNALWLWLEDRAGNSGYTRAQSVTLLYDTLSPAVTLTLPRQVAAAQVVAVWTGFDPGEPITGSGLYSYSLNSVRDDGTSAQQVVFAPATTATVSVASDHTYIFTLGAYDKAGNYTTTQPVPLRVGLFRIYLPLALNKYNNYSWTCTSVDVEPNNDYTQAQNLTNWSSTSDGQKLTAQGNFCPPTSATASEDQIDYFKVTPANSSLSLKLTVPANTNLNLYGYDSGNNLVFSASAPAGSKSIVVPLPAGSGAPYYLKVQRMDAAITQYHAQPYTLEVSDLFKTLTNGSFEEGVGNTVTDWTLSNAGLPAVPVTSVSDGTAPFGSRAILLGDPALACRSMPFEAYAEIKQTFFVPNVSQSLNLRYRYVIFTQDSIGTRPELSPSTLDRFEVYVRGAATVDTLVASDGNTAKAAKCDTAQKRVPGAENIRPQDGAWAVKSVSLDAYKGQVVTVFFRNYSRFDNYYNTYTYLDKVELVGP